MPPRETVPFEYVLFFLAYVRTQATRASYYCITVAITAMSLERGGECTYARNKLVASRHRIKAHDKNA